MQEIVGYCRVSTDGQTFRPIAACARLLLGEHPGGAGRLQLGDLAIESDSRLQ
jgi:hypothetical protein